jgi:hypothetical protein
MGEHASFITAVLPGLGQQLGHPASGRLVAGVGAGAPSFDVPDFGQ